MTKEQSKLFELLTEFDAICRENGIRYYLTGETLKYAVQEAGIGPNAAFASVIMTGNNVRKFMEAVMKKDNPCREIEYWGNNADYPDYTLRYLASDTTAFDMTDYLSYRSHGMYIEIEILRGLNKSKRAKAMRAIEKASAGGFKAKGSKGKIIRASYKLLEKLRGKDKIKQSLFDYFVENDFRPSSDGKYYLCHNGSTVKGLPKELFEGDAKECEINGHAFMIPSDCDYLIQRAKGKSADTFLIDAERPYADTISALKLTEGDFRSIYESNLRLAEIDKIRKKLNRKARANWYVVQQADARLRMQRLYMPKKDKILNLYKEEDYPKLEQEFQSYDEEMEKLLPRKRSFSFDNELLDVYIHLLLYNGQDEKAENIIRWMPKSHLKEI